MDYERVAFDPSVSIERRMAATKAMLGLERLKREHAPPGARPEGETTMEDKVRIVIDCEGEVHELHMGEQVIECIGLEQVAAGLDVEPLGTTASAFHFNP
jgi:hypothetical protein